MAPTDITAFALGEAYFRECQVVHDFLVKRVRPRIQHYAGPNPSVEAATFQGLLGRVCAWMHSLEKLNEPVDFQPVIVGSRALFEVAVDMTLMQFDPSSHPEKMIAWEESAKLKSAIRIQDYFTAKGTQPTAEYDAQIRFIATESTRIEALRAKHWPKRDGTGGRHPDRWTGRPLDRDAVKADELFPKGEFEAFYSTRYPQVCWNTHGSGLAGVRFISPEHFPGLTALAFRECARFAMVAAEVVVLYFRCWDDALAVEFDDNLKQRDAAKCDSVMKARG